jgi:RNA polymerase sigma-B factor
MTSPTSHLRERSPDDQLLFERHRREHSAATREALVKRFLPLALHLARRYPAHGEEEDLEQVAALGLIKAIDRYDPSHGAAFASYAFPTIAGELKRHFRDRGWAVRMPRELQELSLRLGPVADELTARLQREPTAADLADRCAVTIEQVLEALAVTTAHHPVSLDAPPDEHEDARPLEPGADDAGFGRVDDAEEITSLLAVLPPLERKVLHLRFHHELRQREIGELLGLTQTQVSRLIRKALGAAEQSR